MRTLITLTTLLVFFVTGVGTAQITNEEAKLIQEAWGLDKKVMLTEYLDLSEADAANFWPVYDAYMQERSKLGMDRMKILKDYAAQYESLSSDRVDDLTMRLFKNNMAIEKLQMKYYKKMKKAVNPMEAGKFIQAEKYIDAVIRMDVQSGIPFIGEMANDRG
ncbi:hypothetical protein [Robertkochia sediminum]|uniref:hypothetical protein n=1 Tax=Robertkochia sediminum TaxID=2785326 RepID=UPI0019347CC6|nr:hypothetical protein [Robertkochia sediminum]MBL7472864.1 hypothetical protein [Robertkochia sediminum]